MKQLTVAVCDVDAAYLNQFAAYVRNHEEDNFVIHTFTRLEAFMQGLLQQKYDLILIGQGFEAAKEGLGSYDVPVLYLQEEVEVADAAGLFVAETTDYGKHKEKSILKYQSAEAILHEMYMMCEKEEVLSLQENGETFSGVEIIGVYSPIQHEMQVPFSVTMASLLAEKKKVLYLNLMECSGLLEIFQWEGERDLGDLLVKVHQNRLTEEGVRQVLYQCGGLFYIPPARNPENIYEICDKEYETLLSFLEQRMDFEVIVIDFGSMFAGFSELLSHCKKIDCLMKSGPFFECKKELFLQYIQSFRQEKMAERIQMLYLPYSATQVVPTGGLLDQFKWSELGDLIRNHLYGAIAYDG